MLSPLILGVVLLSNASALEADINSVTDAVQKTLLLNQLSQKIILPYIILAAISVGVAALVYFSALPEIKNEEEKPAAGSAVKTSVFQYPQLVLGIVCLFLYVGVEVMAGDAIGAYGKSMGLPLDSTRYFTSFTLISMLAGYIVGIVAIPRWLSQQAALTGSAVLGITLSIFVFFTHGYTAIAGIALMGLANALMWPAIWPLALKNLGRFTEIAAALLIMGIAGGAILPLLYGFMKGNPFNFSNQLSFLVCMLPSYGYILYYAMNGSRVRP